MLLGLDLCLLCILLIVDSCVVYPNSSSLALSLKMMNLSSCRRCARSYAQPTSEETNCGAQQRGLTILNTLPHQGKEGSASGRLHSTGNSVLFLWTTGKRCAMDAPAMPAMQEGFSSWCWLILDHILARKLCSASVSIEDPQGRGILSLFI